ncbi:hypothetical protein V5P93_002952 [Actinokineospora auranticolor]|uniref:Uncharacterized protein n=1 Tax=Actinokineospora auranticolor TaxID=155976 RepID=A0A2S6H0S6_9PSEU|nr:hypothetical protein [Actinokineospora auranticolor]PPK71092.1 hypothetical protein CLV40_101278 [Actinokineospora auranticolor]
MVDRSNSSTESDVERLRRGEAAARMRRADRNAPDRSRRMSDVEAVRCGVWPPLNWVR